MNPQFRMKDDSSQRSVLLQIQKQASLTNSLSSDSTDLMSFEDNTSIAEFSSRPPSATSFLDETKDFLEAGHAPVVKPLPTRQLNKSKSSSVYVMVSGTSFAIPPEAFQKIGQLPWHRDSQGVLHLNTSPAIFEILLSHIVFDTFPAYDTLSKSEYEEFEPMALCLGLYDLVEHYDRSSDKRLRNRGGRSRSSILKKKHKGKSIVLNSESSTLTSSKMMAANSKCARFVASLARSGSNRLKQSKRNIKTTHDQWCASDHIN
jgi:hypothetical protein